jgi:hypothetical protein
LIRKLFKNKPFWSASAEFEAIRSLKKGRTQNGTRSLSEREQAQYTAVFKRAAASNPSQNHRSETVSDPANR